MSAYIKEKTINSNVDHKTKTQILIFLTIVSSCLGEVINIFGIKISWIFAFLTVVFFFIDNQKLFTFKTKKVQIVFWFFLFWICYATVQLLFTNFNSNATTFYVILLINVFLVIMILLNAKSINDLVFFNKALILGLYINLIIAIWEILTGRHLVSLNAGLAFSDKAHGAFGNINDLSTFIAFGVFSVIMDLALTHKHILSSIIIIIVSFYTVTKTNSRAPLYGLIILAIFWLLFELMLIVYKQGKEYFNLLMFFMVSILVILSVMVFQRYNLEQLVLIISSSGNEKSDLLRLQLSKEAISIFNDSYFLGVGPGQSVTLLGINVHNFFLEILSEYGLIVIGVIAIFVSTFKAYKTNLPHYTVALFMAFIPFFTMVSISSSGANRLRITWVLLIIIFLVVDFKNNTSSSITLDKESNTHKSTFSYFKNNSKKDLPKGKQNKYAN